MTKNKIITTIICMILLSAGFVFLVTRCGLFDGLRKTNTDNQNTYASSVVKMEVNPALEFYIDADGKIASVNAVNEEGNSIKSSATFVGKTIQQGIRLFLDAAKAQGYIVSGSGNGDIKISTYTDQDVTELKTYTQNYLQTIGVQSTVKMEEMPNTYLKDVVTDCLKEYTQEELANMSEAELFELAMQTRAETNSFETQELKNLYYVSRAQAIVIAKYEYIYNLIKNTPAYSTQASQLSSTINTLKSNFDTYKQTYTQMVLETTSPVALAKSTWAEMKKSVLDVKKAGNTTMVQMLELSVTFVEGLYNQALEEMQQSIDLMITNLEQLSNDLDEIASEISPVINSMEDGIKNVVSQTQSTYLTHFNSEYKKYDYDVFSGRGTITVEGNTEYIYADTQNNLTYSFNKKEYNFGMYSTYGYACYVYNGQRTTFTGVSPIAFYSWSLDEFDNEITLNNKDSFVFDVDGSTLTLKTNKMDSTDVINYCAAVEYMSMDMTFVFATKSDSSKVVYIFMGTYTQDQVRSIDATAIGAWVQDEDAIVATIEADEIVFTINPDGTLELLNIPGTKIDATDIVDYIYTTNVFGMDVTYVFATKADDTKIVYVFLDEVNETQARAAVPYVTGTWEQNGNVVTLLLDESQSLFEVVGEGQLSPAAISTDDNINYIADYTISYEQDDMLMVYSQTIVFATKADESKVVYMLSTYIMSEDEIYEAPIAQIGTWEVSDGTVVATFDYLQIAYTINGDNLEQVIE